ncbi:hypothetical protein BOX15_Mlig032399g4, partial [Macrostomum lignano]
DSSDQVRQSNERVVDLESQVKQLTELRTGLERENNELKKRQQERVANDSDALVLLHKQLERALASEKLLQKRIDALEAMSKTISPTNITTKLLLVNATQPSTVNIVGNQTTRTGVNNTTENLNNMTLSTTNSKFKQSTVSGTRAVHSAGASNIESSSTMVLRPPPPRRKKKHDNVLLDKPVENVAIGNQRGRDESESAVAANEEGRALI